MNVTAPGILSTRSSSLHNKEDRTQQINKIYVSRQDINTAATHTRRSSRSKKSSGVNEKNINNYMPPITSNNMSGELIPAKDSSDEAATEITPMKSDDTKEGASDINISPGNDASPQFNNQDQGSPNPDWPLTDINEPGPNDCLFGRGGGTNHHPGNKKYRVMVEEKKDKYLSSKRLDKPLVAMEIINEWRSMDPPGRFLKQDDKTKLWSDVGDRKAREKTSQALREKTPSEYPTSREGPKETRFEPGTLSPGGRMRPSLAREHSLGTEPMETPDMSLEGFSWDETDQPVVDNRGAHLNNHHHHPEAPPYSPYHVRHNSLATNPLPEASTANPAPPFGDPYYHHYHPHYSSPPSHHYPHPPPPPPSHYQSPQGHHQYHSSAHSSAGRQREHSLQMNPLKGASTTQPARDTVFTDPNYEGQAPPPYPPPHPSYYYPPGPPQHHWGQPPPPPPQYYPGGQPSAFTQYEAIRSPTNSSEYDDRRASGASSNHNGEEEAVGTSQDFTRLASLIRDSTEGSTLARSSSADESGRVSSDHSIQKSHSMPLQSEEGGFPSPPKNASARKEIGGESPASQHVRKPSLLKKLSGGSLQNTTPVAAPNGALRPEPVKRDTSNQPETLETKRSTKRVILSRDKSAIAKSLKEAQRQKDEAAVLNPKLGLPKADLDRNLSVEMNKLGLNNDNMPQFLDRMTTTDVLGEIFDDRDLESAHMQAQNDLDNADALAHDMYNGGSRLQSEEWDDTLNLLVEGSNESEADPGVVAVDEDVAARWISGTAAHSGTEI